MSCHRTPVKLQLQVSKESALLRLVSIVPTVKKLTAKSFLMKKLWLQ